MMTTSKYKVGDTFTSVVRGNKNAKFQIQIEIISIEADGRYRVQSHSAIDGKAVSAPYAEKNIDALVGAGDWIKNQ